MEHISFGNIHRNEWRLFQKTFSYISKNSKNRHSDVFEVRVFAGYFVVLCGKQDCVSALRRLYPATQRDLRNHMVANYNQQKHVIEIR